MTYLERKRAFTQLPRLVGLAKQHGANQLGDQDMVGEDARHVGAPLDFLRCAAA
jgi:hypothetical protein